MENLKNLIGTPELARVVADLSSDGHLQIKRWRHLTSFYAKEIEEIKKFEQRIFHLFQEKSFIYPDKVGYKIFLTSKKIALFLKEVGVPVGNKTNIPFFIPDWVMNGSAEIKSAYLQGMYDGEGSIHSTPQKNGKNRWRINIEMYKNKDILDLGIKFMEQLRILLKEFGIKTSPVRTRKGNIRKDGSKSIGMLFDIESSSFSNFYKYVGFCVSHKKRRLESFLSRGT